MTRFVQLLVAALSLGCAGKASVSPGIAEDGGTGVAGSGSQPTNVCPTVPTLPDPPTSQSVGTCSTAGLTCSPPLSELTCLSGGGYSVGWNCICDGQEWQCQNTQAGASKGGCSPIIACDYIAPAPGPAMTLTNFGRCNSTTAVCDTESTELCPDGGIGQTVDWMCSCPNGYWTCVPTPRADRHCE
jgi:hypothetical protein